MNINNTKYQIKIVIKMTSLVYVEAFIRDLWFFENILACVVEVPFRNLDTKQNFTVSGDRPTL